MSESLWKLQVVTIQVVYEPQYVGGFQRILGAQTCEEEQGHSRGTGYRGLIKAGTSTELFLASPSSLCDTQDE